MKEILINEKAEILIRRSGKSMYMPKKKFKNNNLNKKLYLKYRFYNILVQNFL